MIGPPDDDLLVFLSYASPDRERVRPFCEQLKAAGFGVWIDYERIKPGQNWDYEINRALSHATFVVAFVSKKSVDRRGYVQKELAVALNLRAEKLIDDIYLVPVILDDDLTLPRQIADIQHIRASEPDCRGRIADAINHQLAKLGGRRRALEQQGGLTWRIARFNESWDGFPGYEIALDYIELESDRYSDVGLVGDYIKGQLARSLFSHRQSRFDQAPPVYKDRADKYWRTNTMDAKCGPPTLIGDALSVLYSINWYGAGAAHSQQGFFVYNFFLSPVTLIPTLREVFADGNAAFDAVQTIVQSRLLTLDFDGHRLDQTWVKEGTKDWDKLSTYIFSPEGVNVLFPPYQVSAYALGSHVVTIPYNKIIHLLKAEYAKALHLNL
jgi:hypothetical protein